MKFKNLCCGFFKSNENKSDADEFKQLPTAIGKINFWRDPKGENINKYMVVRFSQFTLINLNNYILDPRRDRDNIYYNKSGDCFLVPPGIEEVSFDVYCFLFWRKADEHGQVIDHGLVLGSQGDCPSNSITPKSVVDTSGSKINVENCDYYYNPQPITIDNDKTIKKDKEEKKEKLFDLSKPLLKK